jgi:uncharacterized protein (DUF983 family)
VNENNKDLPQFSTAEYAPNTTAVACAACRTAISGQYFSINGAPACPECTRKFQEQMPKDSHGAFVRGVVFGIAGAMVGLALYVGFALATGIVIGWASLAVGFIVGKAMSLGSRGVGGRRYQVVAVLLTYLAVSMSAVPIALYEMRQQPSQAQTSDVPTQHREAMSAGKAVGVLALVGIASPFLELGDPVQGIIGLVILFVGIRFAWRFTAGRDVNITGPHAPAPAGAT